MRHLVFVCALLAASPALADDPFLRELALTRNFNLPLIGFTHMVPGPVISERLETRLVNFLLKVLQAPKVRE